MAVLRKANAHSIVVSRLIKKSITQIKIDPEEKLIQTALLMSFSKKESFVVHIFLHHKRLKQQAIQDTVVQWSTPWVVFLWQPIKFPLVCDFSPSLCMINLKNPYCYDKSKKPCMINLKNHLFAPPDPTNYDKATYIVSSNLCLFTCPQATGFP